MMNERDYKNIEILHNGLKMPKIRTLEIEYRCVK